MTAQPHPWSAVVRLDDIGETGRHVELEASEATRAALARPAGGDAAGRAGGSFGLAPRGGGGRRVTGAVRAGVRQTCVVSLEPLVNEIDEPVDVEFVPAPRAGGGDIETEVVLAHAEDERELLVDGSVSRRSRD